MAGPTRTWRDVYNDFMSYTKAERTGLITLICVIILLNTWNYYDKHHRVEAYDYTSAMAALEAELAQKSAIEPKEEKGVELFPFNPNTVTKNELKDLGFADWKISTFLKYRSSGARFENLDDLKKVYSIDSLDISRVKDFLIFEKKKYKSKNKKIVKRKAKTIAPTLFDFDPNTVTKDDLIALGLSTKVINTMFNFRSKATFRKATDLAKIYGLDKSKYEKLLPYIKIQNKYTKKTIADAKQLNNSNLDAPDNAKNSFEKEDKAIELKSIDINIATVEEWQRIRGIGPAYAGRIVKFRENLGGFYSIEQIGETYGIEDSVYQKIVPYVRASPIRKKLKINIENVETMAKHPYLTWRESQVIFNYIKKHGAFQKDTDVYGCRRFTKEEWQRLLPYFDYSTKVDTFDHDADY